jgi:hypothetical protein
MKSYLLLLLFIQVFLITYLYNHYTSRFWHFQPDLRLLISLEASGGFSLKKDQTVTRLIIG